MLVESPNHLTLTLPSSSRCLLMATPLSPSTSPGKQTSQEPPSPDSPPLESMSTRLSAELLAYSPDALRECSRLDRRDRFREFDIFMDHLRFGDFTISEITTALDRAIHLARRDLRHQVMLLQKCRAYCSKVRDSGRRTQSPHPGDHSNRLKEGEGSSLERSERAELAQMLLNGARESMEVSKLTLQRLQVAHDQILRERA